MISFYQLDHRQEYLEQACAMGRWLVYGQSKAGGLPFVFNTDRKSTDGPCFAFDTGMAIRAWLALNETRPDPAWTESAKRAGIWLVDHMQNPDGSF
jgi:hypothetical protein